jgi:hypothetical protein
MHDAITIGIPVLAILFGILLNQRGLDRVEARMEKMEGTLNGRIDHLSARIDRILADLLQFYRTLGEHDAKIENLEKRKP